MHIPPEGPHPGGLGKIPTYGDFVRHRASGPAWRSFDEWVQRGLFVLKRRSQGRDQLHYPDAPAFCFMHGTDTHVLLGVMQPSEDRVGRSYPLIVALELPYAQAGDDAAARLLMRWHGFLNQAAALASRASDGEMEAAELVAKLDEMEAVADARANAAWDRYVHRTSVRDFLKDAAGGRDGEAQGALLNGLAAAMTPYREHPDLAPRFGLALPLRDSGADASHQIVFWLTAALRMGGLSLRGATICWTPEQSASKASLLAFFGLSAEHAFPHLLPDASDDEHVLYLDRASVDGLSNEASLYETLVQDGAPTLYRVLEQL